MKGTLNVIVTASKLMAAVAKMMMFELAHCVDPHHIYSCWCEGRSYLVNIIALSSQYIDSEAIQQITLHLPPLENAL